MARGDGTSGFLPDHHLGSLETIHPGSLEERRRRLTPRAPVLQVGVSWTAEPGPGVIIPHADVARSPGLGGRARAAFTAGPGFWTRLRWCDVLPSPFRSLTVTPGGPFQEVGLHPLSTVLIEKTYCAGWADVGLQLWVRKAVHS